MESKISVAQEYLKDLISIEAGNIANSSTAGFRRVFLIAKEGQNLIMHSLEQGQSKYTGHKLDVAIHGAGFFPVQSKDEILYTRDGHFSVKDGYLTTSNGLKVLGEGESPIPVSFAGDVNISSSGEVTQNGVMTGKLVAFVSDQPIKARGFNSYSLEEARQDQNTSFIQGNLETQNFNPISVVTSMMEAGSLFSLLQDTASLHHRGKVELINGIGRVK